MKLKCERRWRHAICLANRLRHLSKIPRQRGIEPVEMPALSKAEMPVLSLSKCLY
jgi:hypothetical protein